MSISILPQTSLGRWSTWLTIASILFFILAEAIFDFTVIGIQSSRALGNALTIVLLGLSASAVVTGIISMVNRKERAMFVFVAIVIALYGFIGAFVSLLGLPQ